MTYVVALPRPLFALPVFVGSLSIRFTDWLLFLILDIGNATIEAIPLGTRVLAGLFQGVAVRSGGFAIVPPAALAPAVKYVSCMGGVDL
jgi:Trk-type K+ transport system membrane component